MLRRPESISMTLAGMYMAQCLLYSFQKMYSARMIGAAR
jgi:hypothetical protein